MRRSLFSLFPCLILSCLLASLPLSAEDVLKLIDYVKKTVFEKFQVQLEPEVRLVGDKQYNMYK